MVAIKGMTMPTKCVSCLFLHDDILCELLNERNDTSNPLIADKSIRPHKCPLIELPE